MEIGPPDFLSVPRVFLTKVPDRILAIARGGASTLVAAGDSVFRLVGPAGERLGEFKASFLDQSPTAELLKQTAPAACFPVLDDVNGLCFTCALSRAVPAPPRAKKKAVPAEARRGARAWSAPRTFRALRELRERFDASRAQAHALLVEMQRAAARPPAQIDPRAMRAAFGDVAAFAAEQDACVKAAQLLGAAIER
jgi:hypothetical protein